jgi:hypothetical protein
MIHRRIKHKVVQIIMDLVAKCPELQAKARLPRCTYDPAYIMSLGPRYTSHFHIQYVLYIIYLGDNNNVYISFSYTVCAIYNLPG